MALGLNESDRSLLRVALRSLAGGTVWILAIAFVVGLIHRDVPLTGEVLSRTKPDLFSLIIALCQRRCLRRRGAVTACRHGHSRRRWSRAMAPCLLAPRHLFARADFAMARGALLLALTNVAAIQVAFSAVFWAGGYRRVTASGLQGFLAFLRRDFFSVVVVAVLAASLGLRLHDTIRTSLFESGTRAVLRQHFNDSSGFHLVDVRISSEANATVVRAVVRGPKVPSAETVAAAQANLPPPPDGSALKLRVRFVETVIVTPQGPLGDDGNADP